MSSAKKIWNDDLKDILKPLKDLIPEPAEPAPAAPPVDPEARSEAYQEWIRAKADPPQVALLQRNFDAAIATKKSKKKVTTTTTTTTIDQNHVTEVMNEACAAASALPSWTLVAKWINHPDVAVLYKAANITEGWRHCDKSWVVHSACGDFLPATVTSCTAHKRHLMKEWDNAIGKSLTPDCAQIDWEVPAWESCHLTDSAIRHMEPEWQNNRRIHPGACGGTRTGSLNIQNSNKNQWGGGKSYAKDLHIVQGDRAFQRPDAGFPSFPNGHVGGSKAGYTSSWWNVDKVTWKSWLPGGAQSAR